MTPTRHPRCIPCTGALFAKHARGAWEDTPIISSLLDGDGIQLLGHAVPVEQSVHAVSYRPKRAYLGVYPSMAEAKEAVEQAIWA